MAQSLPPTKPKGKLTIYIIMSILLHVLGALVLYLTVFNEQSTSKPTSSIDKQKPYAPIIVNDKQVSPVNQEPLTISVNEQRSKALPPNNTNKKSAQVIVDTKSIKANKPIGSVDDSKQATTLKTQSSIEKPNNSFVEELASTPTMTTSIETDVKLTDNKSSNQPEYNLKKTQEYEQLDESIDKDSEQLAKLISEVKKRNQSQIQQHQAKKLSNQPKPKVTLNESDIVQDYPITPITPFNDPQNNQ